MLCALVGEKKFLIPSWKDFLVRQMILVVTFVSMVIITLGYVSTVRSTKH